MLEARLKARISSAKFITKAELLGYQLAFHKRSIDGSGKCSIVATHHLEDRVLGIVYDISATDKHRLDHIEGLGKGYELIDLKLNTHKNTLTAFAYIADAQYIDDDLKPYTWYKAFVIKGAQNYGFAESYLHQLASVSAIEDPDPFRQAENEQLLNQDKT